MTIDVHFYSISKDLAGQPSRAVTVPDGCTLADALDTLFNERPALKPLRAACRYAIGTQYASMESELADGDVLSMLPPMQGG